MKVLIDLQSCQNGSRGRGIGRYALAMTRAMIREGRSRHHFRVILTDRFPDVVASLRKEFSDILKPTDVVVVSLPSEISGVSVDSAWRSAAANVVYSKAIDDFGPDVFFSPSIFEGIGDDAVTDVSGNFVKSAALHDLIPLADDGEYLSDEDHIRAYSDKLNVLRRYDLIFSVSEYSKRQAQDLLGISPDKIFVAPLGAEDAFSQVKVSPERAVYLREKYSLGEEFFINAAPHEARKNLKGLISGFAAVDPKVRNDVRVIIVGKMNPPDAPNLREFAASEGLPSGSVVFPGFVPDDELIDLYRICTAMVFPSTSEGFGLPPLEAMASGAPVIASNATSVPEVVAYPRALFNPLEPGEIAELMERVLLDDKFRHDLKTYSVGRSAEFSWAKSARSILAELEKSVVARSQSHGHYLEASSDPVRRVGVVSYSGHGNGRDSAVVKEVVRHLMARYEVTVVPVAGDVVSDVAFQFERLDFSQQYNFADFDRLVYVVDRERVDQVRPLLEARPGVLVVYESLSALATKDDDSESNDHRGSGISSGLIPGATGVLVEEDRLSSGDPGGERFQSRVSLVGPETVKWFRHARGLPEKAQLWAAFVQDEASFEDLVRRFRRSEAAKAAEAWLVVTSAQSSGGGGEKMGRVFRMPEGLDGPYVEILAASERLIIDPSLAPEVRARLVADARGAGLPTYDVRDFDADEPTREALGEEISSEAFGPGLESLTSMLDKGARPLALPAQTLRAFPYQAIGRRPTQKDLAVVAHSIVLNDELTRPGRILLDITGITAFDVRPLSAVVRRFLKSLLRVSRCEVLLVSDRDGVYEVAGAYAGELLGKGRGASHDERLAVRLADKMVSLDAIGLSPNGDESPVWRTGVPCVRIEVETFLFARPDLSQLIAEAVVEVSSSESGDDRYAHIVARTVDEVSGDVSIVFRQFSNSAPTSIYEGDGAINNLIRALGEEPEMAPPAIQYTIQGHVLGTYSLALVNRRLADVLKRADEGNVFFAPYETDPVKDLNLVPAGERHMISAMMGAPDSSKRQVVISQHYPVMAPPASADVGLALFAWEESHVPPSTVGVLNDRFDGVLAQVRTVEKALIDSGVWKPLALTGLPVDITSYEGVSTRQGPAKVFLHVSSCFPRKGVDSLLAAWGQAFSVLDGVRLVIKTFPNPHNDIERQVADLRRRYPSMAPIDIINQDMPQRELVELYRQADVMVLPTRGEGYNLPALEAMAAGLPLIVTGYSGHRDFCGPDDARLLDYDFQMSSSHVRENVSYWVDVSVPDLVEALREQISPGRQQEIERRRQNAIVSARRAVDERRWVTTINDFSRRLLVPDSHTPVRTAWVTTWNVRCGIAEYSRFLLESAPDGVRDAVSVIADQRTNAQVDGVEVASVDPCWKVYHHESPQLILEALARNEAEAVVLQHQDGLITWEQIVELASDERFSQRVTVITMHIARNIDTLHDELQAEVIKALARFDRVIVHTISDLNLMKRHGLIENVALLPHGAISPDGPMPQVRDLSSVDDPIIGCHGFFFHHKRVDHLIRAAALLKVRWPKLRLRLVNARFPEANSDQAIENAQAVAREVGMEASIDWHLDFLPVDEIQALLSGCDLLVMPYDETGDSASGAVRVAMCSLTPLLVTPVKIFEDVSASIATVPNNEPRLLAEAMTDLLLAEARRRELQLSMKRWLDIHDWKRVSKTMHGMIRALAYKRRAEKNFE